MAENTRLLAFPFTTSLKLPTCLPIEAKANWKHHYLKADVNVSLEAYCMFIYSGWYLKDRMLLLFPKSRCTSRESRGRVQIYILCFSQVYHCSGGEAGRRNAPVMYWCYHYNLRLPRISILLVVTLHTLRRRALRLVTHHFQLLQSLCETRYALCCCYVRYQPWLGGAGGNFITYTYVVTYPFVPSPPTRINI